MKIYVDKQCGSIVGNTLRQIALTQLPVLRPVAIKVGETCNVLSAGKDVQEDMTSIISNLTSIYFTPISSESIIRINVTANGELKASDLEQGKIKVCNDDGDKVILTTMGVPVSVTIYFRVGVGVASIQDNNFYLERYGISTKDLVTFVSRHSQISSFAYTVKTQNDDKDCVDITIRSNTDKGEGILLQEIKSKLISIFDNI